jgi:hypothetical protein
LWKGHKLKGAGWVAPADDRKERMERRQGEARMRGEKEERQRSGDGESGEEGEGGGTEDLSWPV